MGMGPTWRPELRYDDMNNTTSGNILIWHVTGRQVEIVEFPNITRISRKDWVLVPIGFPGLPRVTGKQLEAENRKFWYSVVFTVSGLQQAKAFCS